MTIDEWRRELVRMREHASRIREYSARSERDARRISRSASTAESIHAAEMADEVDACELDHLDALIAEHVAAGAENGWTP